MGNRTGTPDQLGWLAASNALSTEVDMSYRVFLNKRLGIGVLATALVICFLGGLVIAKEMRRMPADGDTAAAAAPSMPAVLAVPGSFAKLASGLGPSVVNIKVTKSADGVSWNMPEWFEHGPFEHFNRRFFDDQHRQRRERHDRPGHSQRRRHGAGSGVIISAEGHILTNHHVVRHAEEVRVTLTDGREYEARVVGRDPKTDLAVLQVDAGEPLPVATLGNSDTLRVGDWVMAIGNPFGLSHTVTAGIVSGKGRIIGAGPYDDFIQTDASINPGNSGGPLFNMHGEVVGINTAMVPHGRGIGFAIPIDTAKPLIPQMVATGSVTRGYLGVSIQSITPDLAEALKLDGTQGALVGEVMPDSPAAQAGLQTGDVITAFDGKPVATSQDLPGMVAETPVDQDVTVTVQRQGESLDLAVTVGKMHAEMAQATDSPESGRGNLGLHLRDRLADSRGDDDPALANGVLVTRVQPGSPAAASGIRGGDVILQVDQKPVDSIADVKQLLAETDEESPLVLLVKRGEGSFYVVLKA
jgi:serine protease Do